MITDPNVQKIWILCRKSGVVAISTCTSTVVAEELSTIPGTNVRGIQSVSERFEAQAFGRYFLVDTIAVGGMAEVFKAKTFSEGGFEKLLCIKRILKHLSGNDEFVEMFIDEAKISVELQHANIVPIL